jgi:putative serine protease PepD
MTCSVNRTEWGCMSDAQRIHRIGTYAFSMEPGGAERLRGFRAPGADVAAGSASSPAQVQPERSGSAQAPTIDKGDQISRLGHGWRWAVSTAAVLVVAMVIIAALAFKLGSGSATSANRASATATPTPAATATPVPVTDLYRQVVPSVVLITTSKGSLGSGVIVTDTGTVLTAHHVVSGGGDISIVFADGTKTSGTIAAAYPKIDIATLTPKKLPEVVVPATLGGGVAVGSDVVAIGNPLGLRYSTTTGVVSGLNRRTETKVGALSGLIQFDAAVNPGSSGGPLLNAQGIVVGVVVSIAAPGDDEAFAGIGFAVPIGTALAGDFGPGQGRGPRL